MRKLFQMVFVSTMLAVPTLAWAEGCPCGDKCHCEGKCTCDKECKCPKCHGK